MPDTHVRTHGLFIDGHDTPAANAGALDVLNPSNGEVIARIAHAGEEDVDRAVMSARRAFEGKEWGGLAERTRARLVNKLADAFEANLEELYHLETMNNGRPVNETRAQVSRLPDFFRYNAGLALARRDSVIPVQGPYLNYTLRTPLGVVGNSTPLTTLRLAEIFAEAGLPPGVFNVVTGLGPSTGKALASHHGLDKFVLTGGTEAGRIVGALAGERFTHQTLELGGKTPVVVFDDFDVDQAVNYAAFGAFVGAGQTCICASRHIVHERVYDQFVEKLAKKAKTIRIGDPSDPSVQLGPVISAKQRQRVLNYVEIGVKEGARLVSGGRIPADPALARGFFIEPTVFADVTSKMRIYQEEVFGPFTSITRFKDEAEAISLANDSPFGLAGAVRTNNIVRAHRVAAKLRCGIVWINDHHRLDPASPWGGVGDSGIGRECGTESFDAHFQTKSVMVKVDDQPFDWYQDTAKQPRLN